MYKFNSMNQLTRELEKQIYLTSDCFAHPDREYIFLDEHIIKFHRLDGVLETFNFERFKDIEFRKVKRIFPLNINNLN